MNEILKKLKPGKEEEKRFNLVVRSFLSKLNQSLKDAHAILGGSGAKGTWLSQNHDVDIFVCYNYDKYIAKSAELSTLLYPDIKKSFPKQKVDRLHGSRDYFRLVYEGFNFEIVPILSVKTAKEAVNITDVSPLHTQWINKHSQKIKDETRLAKQFCKANKLYGAESHLTSFSGYVLEILIAYYGSFKTLLQASQKWKVKDVIDVAKHYKNKEKVFFELNKSKLNSPLIIIDPVDKSRNAAAALSLEKFNQFKEIAKKYLHKPDESFFVKDKIDLESLQQKAGKKKLVYLELEPLRGKNDVVGVKLLKAFNFLKKELEPFLVVAGDWDYDSKAVFYFILRKGKLPLEKIKPGPPLIMKEFVKDFKKKNKDCFQKKGRIYARVKVKNFRLEDLMNDLLKKPYFKEKVIKVKKIVIR